VPGNPNVAIRNPFDPAWFALPVLAGWGLGSYTHSLTLDAAAAGSERYCGAAHLRS